MTWWAWTLLWIVLVLVAGGVLYLAARRLFRQGAALVRELGEAAELLSEVTRALEEPVREPATPAEPADRPRPSARATRGRPRRTVRRQDVR